MISNNLIQNSKYYSEKIPLKEKKIKKCKKKISFFNKTINENEICQKKKWINKFESYWAPGEKNALKELNKFISSNIENYSEARNFPNIKGTSKLSPFIGHHRGVILRRSRLKCIIFAIFLAS